MRILYSILLVLIIVFSGSCSNTRFLAEGEMLYTGRKDITVSNPEKVAKKKTSQVKNQVSSITSHKVNNALFGRRVLPPIGLWVHNYWKHEHKIGKWLYKTLSSTPVLVSDVNPELRAKKIENDLFDLGYFHTKAWSVIDTSKKNPHKAMVSYFVNLSPPFNYSKVILDTIEDHLDTLISRDKFMKQIKPGDQFNLDYLKSSREGMSKRLQDSGYFYIIPEFIDLKADTLHEPNKIDLIIGKKKQLPAAAISVYTINDIIFKNKQGSDTLKLKSDTVYYGDIGVISPPGILKAEVLINSLYFHKGDIYSYSSYQKTLNRLNNLGIFKSVNISYKNNGDSLSTSLDVMVNTVMSDNIRLDLEGNLTSKSSGYIGPLFSIGVSHGNALKGAERLKVGLTGGFDWQWGTKSETQLGTYSYEFGLNSGLMLPRIVIPFRHNRVSTMIMQRTSVNADFSVLNRTAYYKMFSVKTNIDYEWSRNKNIQHSFYPVYLNSVNLIETTPEFDSVVNENIYIRKSFEEQFILGSKYEFTYNNTLNVRPNNFLFQASIGTSGNLLDLIKSAGKTPEERPYTFLNNIYSQYIKITADFRYYHNGYNKSLVLRLYAGLGMPYSNSSSLPYVEQFFSGGAYSIRGFTARYVGPGSFYTTDQSGYIDQSGDIKLEGNIEYRFTMSKILKGALFIDAGNIWLTNEDPSRPGAKFDKNTFYNELAVGSGFGLRFDFGFFVMRTDVGFPIRTPYLQENNKNWLFGTDKILSGGLFYLAIGYPF
jgi:outer membrane protein assembly factor BamA